MGDHFDIGNEYFLIDRETGAVVPVDPARVTRRADGSYLIDPDGDDQRAAEDELERLMWTDQYTPGPFRPRRNMTTVELPRFPGDQALFCWRTNGGSWPCGYCFSKKGCGQAQCYR